MPTVLVLTRDPRLARTLRATLTAEQHQVRTAAPAGATHETSRVRPNVVIADLDGECGTGIEALTRLHIRGNVPILALSTAGGSTCRARLLDAGVADCVPKTMGMEEFSARVRAMVRRSAGSADADVARPEVVRTAAFTVDLTAKKVARQGIVVHLTPTEWALMEMLVRSEGRLVGRHELLAAVWGPACTDETHYLRVYLGQLRRKLEPQPDAPQHLITEPGMGYRFER